MPGEGAHDTVNDLQTTIDVPKRPRDARDVDQDRTVTSAARQSSSRASLHRHSPTHLILQPVALFLLPALRNSILLVASNSLQLTNEIIVSSGSASIVNE